MKNTIKAAGTLIILIAAIKIVLYGRIGSDIHSLRIDSKKETEAADEENNAITKEMPKITDIIISDNNAVVLCEDGSVWEQKCAQDNDSKVKCQIDSWQKMDGLENITKIMDLGLAKYALSSGGYIYAWGANQSGLINPETKWGKVFEQPVVVNGISNVLEIDAKNGKAFATDKDGEFYAWGIALYKNDGEDMRPGLPEEGRNAVNCVKKIFIGAGEYHYFMREDGSVFSIMTSPMDLTYVDAFIFPDFTTMEEGTDLQFEEKYFELDRPESAIRIDEGSKCGKTILYEMGSAADINQMAADGYTMFIVKADGTLWYWNSERIKYHDNKAAMADVNSKINYGGKFIAVDYTRLLNGEENRADDQKITDLCAGKENVLFLTDSGQVFISKYVTTEIKDVEYYNRGNTKPGRTVFTSVHPNMHLKTLSFQKLDYENIVHINTDGKFHFSLLDKEGNIFALDMSVK